MDNQAKQLLDIAAQLSELAFVYDSEQLFFHASQLTVIAESFQRQINNFLLITSN